MKIVFIGINYAPEHTGIAPYTASMASALARTGDQVRVITGYPHYPQWRVQQGYAGLSRTEHIDHVRVHRVRHYVPARPAVINRFFMEFIFGLRAAFSRWGRPDVIVLVSPALFSSMIAIAKARLRGIRTFVWVQDIYSLGATESGTTAGAATWLVRFFERATLRASRGVIAIHERFKRYLVDELGIESGKIHVVRNWSHIANMKTDRRSEFRQKYGWGRDDVIVLHAGNMGAKQDLGNVINASKLAEQEHSAVKFVLLGDGNQRESLMAMGTNSRLEYIGSLPDGEFEETLAAADILLVNERPGLTEMCVPSKLTSYFSTGRPVIAATDETSITAEELAFAKAGIRVDAAQPEQLLAAAEFLAADIELSCTYGKAGLAFKAAYLTEDRAVRAFRATISNL